MQKEEKQIKITTPIAIIVAGALIMTGILLTGGIGGGNKEKTLSQQLGISKEKLIECIEGFDETSFYSKIESSIIKANKNDSVGTPYIVIAGENGIKIEVRGAEEYDAFKKYVEDINTGTAVSQYNGEIVLDEEGDHVYGNPNAPIKIIEYSDYECRYCKKVHETIQRIVDESNGGISWTYRHLPILGPNSIAKAIAGECVAQIKGNEAFWKYTKLTFDMLKTGEEKTFEDNL
jgi:glutaredoxin